MFDEEFYQLECQSLRQQLNDAYEKCTRIYQSLSILDDRTREERMVLEQMIIDLQQTLRTESEQNQRLLTEKFHLEMKTKLLEKELATSKDDRNRLVDECRKLYVRHQQEKYIEQHRINSIQ